MHIIIILHLVLHNPAQRKLMVNYFTWRFWYHEMNWLWYDSIRVQVNAEMLLRLHRKRN